MKKFEYKTIVISPSWKGLDTEKATDEINVLGKEGWELVNVVSYGGMFSLIYTFKREI